ncbi:NUDIX domain-containing protein [uncultured Jatrophihabitans sp.]|uniref:NUDIX hydrolase n=1 Tax=uncultured Jatrophihabitans sp. TaxID=1610747 RepID=UPI0035CA9C60
MARRTPPDVRAAGGVVWRVRDGRTEVALVHRPRYDDWSLPKGKLNQGETDVRAAVREVEEELGSQVAVSRYISAATYQTHAGRKQTTYWVMRHLRGEFAPNDEVDEVRWLSPTAARDVMSYQVDKHIMADFAAVPVPDTVVVLVRHAKAGKRSEWRGNDDLRPLDDTGRTQADSLVSFLTCFAPTRVVSAAPVRCTQTVAPFADKYGFDISIESAFGDKQFAKSPATSETTFWSLAKPGTVNVIASQGDTIPGLIDRLARGVRPADTRKGAAWVLSVVDGTVVSADYYDDASR